MAVDISQVRNRENKRGLGKQWYSQECANFLIDMEVKAAKCKLLKERSLFEVIENFDAIMELYFANEKENSQKVYFEYLRRYHSIVILEAMLLRSEGKPLKESHITFLVNIYTEKLNLAAFNFSDSTFSTLTKCFKICGHKILSVNLSGRTIFQEEIGLLSLMPNLQTIYLDKCRSRYDLLEMISNNCIHIKNISLRFTRGIKNSSLPSFCKKNENGDLEVNSNIEYLDFTGTAITEPGLEFALKYFPNLKTLRNVYITTTLYNLHCKDLINGTLKNLQKYALQEIDLSCNAPLLQVLKICNILCPDISSIFLHNIHSSSEMDVCFKSHCLSKATLHFNIKLVSDYLSSFLTLQKYSLKKLELKKTRIPLAILSQCHQLKKLTLIQPIFEKFDESLKPSSDVFPVLTHLHIAKVDFANSDVRKCVSFILLSSPMLISLALHGSNHFPSQLDSICRCNFVTHLLELSLTLTILTKSAMEKLSVFPFLRKLELKCDNNLFTED